MKNSLFIGRAEGYILIKAEGEIKAGNTFALNDYLAGYLNQGTAGLRLLIELSRCIYMDSTFIGFIISLQKKCEKKFAATVEILNPSAESTGHLKKLFVLDKLEVKKGIPVPDIPLLELVVEETSFSDEKNLKIIFDAHDELSKLSDENRKEFQMLLEGLQAEINR